MPQFEFALLVYGRLQAAHRAPIDGGGDSQLLVFHSISSAITSRYSSTPSSLIVPVGSNSRSTPSAPTRLMLAVSPVATFVLLILPSCHIRITSMVAMGTNQCSGI